ncbi:FH2 domain-containing protein 1 [Oryzias latipes]|uniref:FH2 domain containing 3 n=1 Tax=Oryzias latipes TaxID=8090 RepID=A0A3B3HEX6_ORYLA|nr:FH2 domain-containing protein 1 [Oryzias latipes]
MEEVLILKPTPSSSSSQREVASPLPLDAQKDPDPQASSAAPAIDDVVAAPPLPPPPPPPPLPPPPHLSLTSFGPGDVQKRSMKKLNWDTIPSQFVVGKLNVWTSKRPQRDLVLDIQTMEELFCHTDKEASLCSSRFRSLRRGYRIDPPSPGPQVRILDSKKSMNVGIFLRHFKRPVTEIVADIHQGNWLRFGANGLKELCKLLPDESEVKQLLSFSGKLSLLPEADQFMVQLVKVPSYEQRLKTMMVREEFFPFMEEVKDSVSVMTKAAQELLDCDDLHSVIRLVLKAGNYMNAGSYSANAIGFRMSSLLKLADTKANKPGMNLMHYVAKQAEDIDTELLTFPTQLPHIGRALRICKDEVIADFDAEVSKIEEVKRFSSKEPSLLKQMGTFLLRAEPKLADLERSLQELNALSDAVAEYFCEDPAAFKLEDCCSIFNSFCRRFETAVQENREREAKEQRHKRKESTRFAAKRRSTGSCTGAETIGDSVCLESSLRNLLSTVPSSFSRCRRNGPLPAGVLPAKGGSPPAERAVSTPRHSKASPEKKHAKLPKTDEQTAKQKNKDSEDVHENSRTVLHLQKRRSSLDGHLISGSCCHSEKGQDKPSTPVTPQPKTRDYFFVNDGDMGSPWTILSPVPSSQRTQHIRNLTPSTPSRKDLADGLWETDSSFQPRPPNRDVPSSPSNGFPHQRVLLHGPLSRSASTDEAQQSSASRSRLGHLFQRSMTQIPYSSCSRDANKREDGGGIEGSSGFISFFKRIGGRNKPGEPEEPKM